MALSMCSRRSVPLEEPGHSYTFGPAAWSCASKFRGPMLSRYWYLRIHWWGNTGYGIKYTLGRSYSTSRCQKKKVRSASEESGRVRFGNARDATSAQRKKGFSGERLLDHVDCALCYAYKARYSAWEHHHVNTPQVVSVPCSRPIVSSHISATSAPVQVSEGEDDRTNDLEHRRTWHYGGLYDTLPWRSIWNHVVNAEVSPSSGSFGYLELSDISFLVPWKHPVDVFVLRCSSAMPVTHQSPVSFSKFVFQDLWRHLACRAAGDFGRLHFPNSSHLSDDLNFGWGVHRMNESTHPFLSPIANRFFSIRRIGSKSTQSFFAWYL